jgi:hypothetical protein
VAPDDRTFPFALHAAATAAADADAHPAKGLELHAAALRTGLLADVFAGNTLVAFFAACGSTLTRARQGRRLLVRGTPSCRLSWPTRCSMT